MDSRVRSRLPAVVTDVDCRLNRPLSPDLERLAVVVRRIQPHMGRDASRRRRALAARSIAKFGRISPRRLEFPRQPNQLTCILCEPVDLAIEFTAYLVLLRKLLHWRSWLPQRTLLSRSHSAWQSTYLVGWRARNAASGMACRHPTRSPRSCDCHYVPRWLGTVAAFPTTHCL